MRRLAALSRMMERLFAERRGVHRLQIESHLAGFDLG
jgi:hypothetical protein